VSDAPNISTQTFYFFLDFFLNISSVAFLKRLIKDGLIFEYPFPFGIFYWVIGCGSPPKAGCACCKAMAS